MNRKIEKFYQSCNSLNCVNFFVFESMFLSKKNDIQIHIANGNFDRNYYRSIQLAEVVRELHKQLRFSATPFRLIKNFKISEEAKQIESGDIHFFIIPVNFPNKTFYFVINDDKKICIESNKSAELLLLSNLISDDLIKSIGDHKTYDFFDLTNRELECLTWVACGKTSFEISIILNLSEHTVNNYVANATTKLRASTRPGAVAIAVKLGIINPELP